MAVYFRGTERHEAVTQRTMQTSHAKVHLYGGFQLADLSSVRLNSSDMTLRTVRPYTLTRRVKSPLEKNYQDASQLSALLKAFFGAGYPFRYSVQFFGCISNIHYNYLNPGTRKFYLPCLIFGLTNQLIYETMGELIHRY